MVKKNRSNVLLVEILIAVLFFMLSATVLIQVFATSRNMTVRANVETAALAQAQNVAETLCLAADPGEELTEMGFAASHGAWTYDYGDYTIYVSGTDVPTQTGMLWDGEIRAFLKTRNVDVQRAGDLELFSLPCSFFREVEPS